MTRSELLKTAKPILFNTEMVRAILDGRKTVTRRVALSNKDLHEFHSERYPHGWWLRGRVYKDWDTLLPSMKRDEFKCRYRTGDILYVRETWRNTNNVYCYRADTAALEKSFSWEKHHDWRPSIHMPKEAARIFLRVTDVRVEMLQDCGNAQAKDEGFTCGSQFARLWNTTIKKSDLARYGWAANPWVWVIEFERLEVQE